MTVLADEFLVNLSKYGKIPGEIRDLDKDGFCCYTWGCDLLDSFVSINFDVASTFETARYYNSHAAIFGVFNHPGIIINWHAPRCSYGSLGVIIAGPNVMPAAKIERIT